MKSVQSVIIECNIGREAYIKGIVSVPLISSNDKFAVSRYTTEDFDTTTISILPKFILRLKLNNVQWTRDFQITVLQKYFGEFKNVLLSVKRYLKTSDCFVYDENGYLINLIRKENDIAFYKDEYGYFELYPELIPHGENNIPGVRLIMNNSNATVAMSIYEYNSFVDEILGINLYMAGMLTLSSYFGFLETPAEVLMKQYADNTPPPTNNHSQQESVSGLIRPKPKSLFDL